MGKEVFANGREISSKKSGANRFSMCPDVCFSPPPPPPAPKLGVPIPYPNFSKSGTLKKGSKTVKIKGAPISLKNVSFYKSSNGDEPATKAFKKGVMSAKIQDKSYATSWSSDVKVEGKNVARFIDSSNHNNKNTPC